MESHALVSCIELMQALRDLCADKQTGTMLIVTDDNHSMQFVLQDGNIVACRAGLKEGRDAIQWIKTVKTGRYFFNKIVSEAITSSASLQTSTDELLKELTGKGIQAAPEQTIADAALNAVRKAVEEELKDTIGPIAGMICEDCFDEMTGRATSDLVKLLNKITMEVEARKREQFKERLIARLKPLNIQQVVSEFARS